MTMLSTMFNSKKEPSVPVDHHRLEAPVKKPVHEAAVDFAQAVVELQQAKSQTEVDLKASQAALATAVAEIASLTKQLEQTKSDMIYYHHRVVEIETKLRLVGGIVHEVFRTSQIHPDDLPEIPQVTDGRAAVAAALDSLEGDVAVAQANRSEAAVEEALRNAPR